MPYELPSANDSAESNLQSRDTSTASRLFDEAQELTLARKTSTASSGRGDTRPTAGSTTPGLASGFGGRHGTPTTLADDVAENMKEHPIATGIESLLFPPLVILDMEIRKLVDKPVPRTTR